MTLDKWIRPRRKIAVIKAVYRKHRKWGVAEWHIAHLSDKNRRLLEEAWDAHIASGEEIEKLYQKAYEQGIAEYYPLPHEGEGYLYFPDKVSLRTFLADKGYEVVHINKVKNELRKLRARREA